MKRSKRIILLFSCLCILFGCSSEQELEFVKDQKIEAGIKFNSCTLIKSVNGRKITKFDMDGNRIVVGNDTITCPYIDTSKVGEQTVEFKFNDKSYHYTIEVCDMTAPVIQFNEDQMDIPKGSTNEELIKHLEISDLYSEFKVEIEGILNLNEAGEYSVEVVVKDSEGNEAKKSLTVKVIEIKKEEVPPKQIDKKDKDKTNSLPSSSNQTNEKNTETKKPDSEYHATVQNKTFLFSDGYDYNSSYEAAVQYAESMMRQGKAKGYNCVPMRNDKQEYIGYQVIFK